MTIEASLATYIDANAPSVGNILSFGHVPQSDQLPQVFYILTGADHEYHLGGSAGTCTKHYDFHFVSTDANEAATLAEDLRLVLSGYQGPMASDTVLLTTIANEVLDYVQPENAEDVGVHVLTVSYNLKYREPQSAFTGA